MMNAFRNLAWSTASVLLLGCTVNPYTGERQASKAASYGAGAAAVCGLVGAGESSKRARNAALGCGAIGAGVGAYMDVQEAKLRQGLEGSGVQVVRHDNDIQLIMPSNITFETDSQTLKAGFYDTLNSVGLVLAKYNDTTLRVTGHTDSVGQAKYNLDLSYERARTVADYLATQGVESVRMYVEGLGEKQPVASNNDASGRALNRRVELTILPKSST